MVQVICDLFGQVRHSRIVRNTLDPEFNTKLTFTIPNGVTVPVGGGKTSPSDHAKAHGVDLARITLIHRDQEEQLWGLAEACSVEVVDKGTLLTCVGDKPDKMAILASGTVGLFESLQHAGSHGARARTRRDTEPSPGGKPAPRRMSDLVEVGRVSRRGACFGEESVLLGETPRITACALTRYENKHVAWQISNLM